MSLLTTNGVLIRDTWKDVPQLVDISHSDKALLKSYEVVPDNLVELAAWAYPMVNDASTDRSRLYKLVHATLGHEKKDIYEVMIRVQGFVMRHNLHPLGDWSGDGHSAAKASQSLTLFDGGQATPFGAQMDVLNRVRDMIIRTLSHGVAGEARSCTRLHMQRRVFTKITKNHSPPSVLTIRDDPKRTVDRVAGNWVASEKLVIALADEKMNLKRCSHIVIRHGDFVDVTLQPEIVTKNGTVKVYYTMQRVVLLKTKAAESSEKAAASAPKAAKVAIKAIVDFTVSEDVTESVDTEDIMNINLG